MDANRIMKLLTWKFLLTECRMEGKDIFVRFRNGATDYYTIQQAVELITEMSL